MRMDFGVQLRLMEMVIIWRTLKVGEYVDLAVLVSLKKKVYLSNPKSVSFNFAALISLLIES